jgi:hypothetical protein
MQIVAWTIPTPPKIEGRPLIEAGFARQEAPCRRENAGCSSKPLFHRKHLALSRRATWQICPEIDGEMASDGGEPK